MYIYTYIPWNKIITKQTVVIHCAFYLNNTDLSVERIGIEIVPDRKYNTNPSNACPVYALNVEYICQLATHITK